DAALPVGRRRPSLVRAASCDSWSDLRSGATLASCACVVRRPPRSRLAPSDGRSAPGDPRRCGVSRVVLASHRLVIVCALDSTAMRLGLGLWWAEQGSNLRPRPCKGRALPAELSARDRILADLRAGVNACG